MEKESGRSCLFAKAKNAGLLNPRLLLNPQNTGVFPVFYLQKRMATLLLNTDLKVRLL
jgi:hypothetical protein